MKRFYVEFESDKVVCGKNSRIYGYANSLNTAKRYIKECRLQDANNPRNFRIYDTLGDCEEDEHVPCVYSEM